MHHWNALHSSRAWRCDSESQCSERVLCISQLAEGSESGFRREHWRATLEGPDYTCDIGESRNMSAFSPRGLEEAAISFLLMRVGAGLAGPGSIQEKRQVWQTSIGAGKEQRLGMRRPHLNAPVGAVGPQVNHFISEHRCQCSSHNHGQPTAVGNTTFSKAMVMSQDKHEVLT